jgi:hypothetical protein
MRALVATALQLGWTLWAYEAAIPADADPAELAAAIRPLIRPLLSE